MNANGFRMRVRDLLVLIHCHNLAIICLKEIHLCLSHALNLRGYMAYHYDHPDSKRAVEKDSIYCTCHPQYLVAGHCYASVPTQSELLLCKIYMPPVLPVSQPIWCSYYHSYPHPSFFFNTKNLLWGSTVTNRMGRSVCDVCAWFDLNIFITGHYYRTNFIGPLLHIQYEAEN